MLLLLIALLSPLIVMAQASQNFPGGSSSVSSPAPQMGMYLGNSCSVVLVYCFNTPADTQQNNAASYSSASTTVTAFQQVMNVSASVTSNVVTYTSTSALPSSWAAGNSITVTQFVNNDTFFNITCTLSAVTSTTVTCPLVHANASSSSFGIITNSNVGPFISGDVGKRMFGYGSCAAFINLSANSNNAPMTTNTTPLTVATFVSSTQVTLSGNPVNSVASNGCVIWGHPDDAGAAQMSTAMAAANYCVKGFLANANYMFTTIPGFLANNTNACSVLGASYPNSGTLANIFWTTGQDIEGRGRGPTTIYLTPGFPESGSGCVNGLSKIACLVIPVEARWSDFQITGGGNYEGYNIPANAWIVEIDGPAEMNNVTLINFGGLDKVGGGTTQGIAAAWWAQLNNVDNSGWGNTELFVPTNSVATGTRVALENPGAGGWDLSMGFLNAPIGVASNANFDKYNFICYECRLWPGFNGASGMIIDGGQSLKLYHTAISPNVSTTNNLNGIRCTSGTCNLDLEDTDIDMAYNGGTTGTGLVAIKSQGGHLNTTLKNSTLKGSTVGGNSYTDDASSTLRNMGGNTVTSPVTISGSWQAVPQESGTVTCATSAATITFKGTYINNPIVLIQDQTTAGVVTQTSLSNTTKVVGCPGASDVLLYSVTPNPF